MKYLKAYLSALVFFIFFLGGAFFALEFLSDNALSEYFAYIAVFASFGGPISVLLNEKDAS